MQTPESERRIPAHEKRNADVASELREILGMRHLWVVDADGERPEPTPDLEDHQQKPTAGP
jgi:hypothetical protein